MSTMNRLFGSVKRQDIAGRKVWNRQENGPFDSQLTCSYDNCLLGSNRRVHSDLLLANSTIGPIKNQNGLTCLRHQVKPLLSQVNNPVLTAANKDQGEREACHVYKDIHLISYALPFVNLKTRIDQLKVVFRLIKRFIK